MLSKLFSSSSSKIISFGRSQGKQLYSSTVIKKRIYEPNFFSTQNNWKSLNISNFSTLQNNKSIGEKNQNFSTTPEKPSTTNDHGTQIKEIKEWWNEKPFEQGTKDEVQNFFQTYKDGKYKEDAPKFVRLNGKDLVKMTEKNFLRRSPEIGDVLFNHIQALKVPAADFFDQFFATCKAKVIEIQTSAERRLTPFTAPDMKYLIGNRQPQFDEVFTQAFQVSFQAFTFGLADKQERKLTWVFGPAGIGKTRFCMELLNQLQAMLENSPEYETRWKEYFCNRLTLILDLKNHGYAVTDWERSLPTDTLLAIRIFLQFFCPPNEHDVYRALKQMLATDMSKNDIIRYLTSYNVLAWIANGILKPFNTTEHYKPPKMIHLAVDEIQYIERNGWKVDYEGVDETKKGTRELMTVAICRSLAAAATISHRDLFVFPSISGIMLEKSTLDAFGTATHSVGLRLLNFESFEKLANENSRFKLPEQTLKLCYAVCGGNLRVINALFELLNKYSKLPIFDDILDELGSTVKSKLATDVWRGEAYLALYAAISGISIKNKEFLITQVSNMEGKFEDVKMNLHQLTGIGGCSITPRPASFSPKIANFVQVPFVVALQALANSSNPHHNHMALLAKKLFLLKPSNSPKSKDVVLFRLLAFRFLVAGQLSKHDLLLNSSSTTLFPQDLFYGAISSVAFDKLTFQSPEELKFRNVPSEWCVESKIPAASSIIRSTQSGFTEMEDLDLNKPNSWEFKNRNGKVVYCMSAIGFDGHRDAMDGVFLVRFLKQNNDQNRPGFEDGLLWYDAITSSETNELKDSHVESRIAKLRALSEKFSTVKHALILVSNRHAQPAAIQKVKECPLPVALICDTDEINNKSVSRLESIFGPSIAPWFQVFDLK